MAITDVNALNGMFKTIYAPKIQNAPADFAIVQKRVAFDATDRIGNYYSQPVNLSREQGFTYNGTAGTVVTLNAAVTAQMKEAQVYSCELILRTQLTNTAISKAKTSEAAFKKTTAWKVEDMLASMRLRLEVAILYGQVGVGTVLSLSGQAITLTPASWAGGIWAGSEGAVIDVFQTNLSTLRQGALSISAVNSDTQTLTVTGTTTGIVATDVLFFQGANVAGTFNEMAGLQKIITNTGLLFNINASSYSLWKGTSDTTGGQPSFARIQAMLSKAVNKGLMEKVVCLLSPKAWAALNTDLAALRVLDSSYSSKKLANGSEALEFHSVNGTCELVCHPLVKDGDIFIVPPDSMTRIGSTDVTFGLGGSDTEFFFPVAGQNAVELQCMCDQAIFVERPAHCVYASGNSYT